MSQTLLLLFAFFPYVSGISLTSSPAQIKAAGQSVRLSCQISGYALTDYGTAWIRHPPGKAMEWIGIIWGRGSIDSGNSFKSRFTISRDTRKNELYLDISSLQTEDTAVYYCAKTAWSDGAFDYWGKGTMVTVTSAQPSAPQSVFGLSQCSSGSDGSITLGCLAKGFSPADSLNFKWKDPAGKDLSDFVQYPAFGKEGDYTKISHIRVKKSDWIDTKNYTCEASNSVGAPKTASLAPPEDVKKDPEVEIRRSFMKSSAPVSDAVLECVVGDLSPGEVCITFQANNVDISDLDCVDSAPSNNSWSLIRNFTIPSSNQTTENNFTCKVHRAFKEWTSKPTGHIFDNASSELVVGPKVVQSSSEYQKLLCSATGFYPKIQWLPQSSVKASNSTVTLMQDGHVKVYSEILVPQDEWNKGVNYTCLVTDGTNREPVEKNTSICSVIAPSSQQADVFLLGPPLSFASSDLNLTCIVIGQNVEYFIFQWKVNGNNSDGIDQAPVQHLNGTQSKVNLLKVSVNTWNSHALITCEVKHLCSVDTQKQRILKTRDPKQPTVRILRPSDSDLSGGKISSLVCFISDFFPSDILVEWKLNGKQLSRSQFSNSPLVALSSGGFSMHSALILPGEQQKDGIYSCEVSHESSQKPINATLENLYASLHHSAPSAELLQGADGLMCLVSGFSPSSINITWFMGMTEMSEQNKTKLAKYPDGKFLIQSHLPLKPSDWAPGEVYTCRVTHVTGTQWFNISKNSVISEEAIFMNEIKPEFIPQDTVGEVWNMACAFLILFLLALVYGCTVTLVKVKSE